MTDTYTIIDEILFWVSRDATLFSKEDFHKLKNSILAKYRESEWPSHIEMIERYNMLVRSWQLPDDFRVRRVLRKRAVRSLSGVSVISLLTKFWWCPGKCIYCPTYDNLPKSYISNEPAVQRAEMNEFDPFRQVQNRLQSLSITGNAISKCDVRIIGWTWSVYPEEYKEEFIKQIYDAHTAFGGIWRSDWSMINDDNLKTDDQYVESPLIVKTVSFNPVSGAPLVRGAMESEKSSPFTRSGVLDNTHFIPSKTLEEAKKRNETAMSRVIGMAIETRPDWIDENEIRNLRRYGVTRVEIGYQTTDDRINEINKRWHWNRESIRATQLLKDAGFKVVAHMMPWLVGATPEWDIASMREIFENPLFRPDELKIYPLVVTPNSELTKIWERWEFTPYDDATLIPLMAELQWLIPEYVRLNRMYRDIPASEILAGSKVANLRQVTEVAMRARGITRHDISAREIRAKGNSPHDAIIEEYFYEASGGHEWFFQMIDPSDRTLFGLLRLRIPSQIFTGEKHFLDVLDGAAIIREVHVFGDQLPIGYHPENWVENVLDFSFAPGQHMGFGKKMLEKAYEKIKVYYPQCRKVAVIAWVGSRPYYEKQVYKPFGEYMIRSIDR